MSESICLQCGHKRICAMGINQPHENVTVTGCSRFEQKQPLTNADKIRAMTDEEMAKFLENNRGGCRALTTETYRCGYQTDDFDTDCDRCWLDWLKQEATDG